LLGQGRWLRAGPSMRAEGSLAPRYRRQAGCGQRLGRAAIASMLSIAGMARVRLACLGLGCGLGLAGCTPATAPPSEQEEPVAAVRRLADLARNADLAGYARAAVPPALAPQLEQAWRDGRGRWPLDELPFAERLPQLLQALSASGAEPRLRASFDRQFAGADRELRAAAQSLSLFGAQYVRHEGRFSPSQRDHYAQLIDALGHWGRSAPLSDPGRAHAGIARLTKAARATGLATAEDLRRAGMDTSLRRLRPLLVAVVRSLEDYGLDLERAMAGLEAELLERDGDRARVRVRYRLGGRPIDTVLGMQRIDGRWYLDDSLRNVRIALARAPAAESPAADTQRGTAGDAGAPLPAAAPRASARPAVGPMR
jgi:hypothetical protein